MYRLLQIFCGHAIEQRTKRVVCRNGQLECNKSNKVLVTIHCLCAMCVCMLMISWLDMQVKTCYRVFIINKKKVFILVLYIPINNQQIVYLNSQFHFVRRIWNLQLSCIHSMVGRNLLLQPTATVISQRMFHFGTHLMNSALLLWALPLFTERPIPAQWQCDPELTPGSLTQWWS